MSLETLLQKGAVASYEKSIFDTVKTGWDKVAKPLDSMGVFEELIARIGAIQKTNHPRLAKTAVVIFAADNGIVNQGVSQSGQEVTAICAENMCKGLTSVCVMAKACDVETVVVDVGLATEVKHPNLLQKNVRRSTRDFSIEPAMTEEEMKQALRVGFDMAHELKEKGYDALGVGEIGIGNTTTSSALAAVLLGEEVEKVTGYGAGLSESGFNRKIQVIKEALAKYEFFKNHSTKENILKALQTVGGLDIAGMVGLFIGAADAKIPVVLDGVISQVAALVACRLVDGVKDYLIASHKSKEPASEKIVRECELTPVIDASMALGEGTGAVLMISLLKTALSVYSNCCPFEDVGIPQYERYTEES